MIVVGCCCKRDETTEGRIGKGAWDQRRRRERARRRRRRSAGARRRARVVLRRKEERNEDTTTRDSSQEDDSSLLQKRSSYVLLDVGLVGVVEVGRGVDFVLAGKSSELGQLGGVVVARFPGLDELLAVLDVVFFETERRAGQEGAAFFVGGPRQHVRRGVEFVVVEGRENGGVHEGVRRGVSDFVDFRGFQEREAAGGAAVDGSQFVAALGPQRDDGVDDDER
mmetsp:Transcript_11213/g.33627  ORF Transcript_11213/g.33627 Transcript_11213/m.33627 type:complete len:224 (+) Transcript_11213:1379-2050(+)